MAVSAVTQRPGCAGLLASRQRELTAVWQTDSQHRRDARVPLVAPDDT
jgi:hypothetical protein